MFFRKKDKKILINWKNDNKEYLYELQLLLDKAEKIENDFVRKEIIIQMLKCNDALTKICEKKLIDFYEEGYKKGKVEHNKI